MAISVAVVQPRDARWSSVLARAPHDVYHTPEYVMAEAHRLGADPVGFLVDEDDRLFFLPLLVRTAGNVECTNSGRDTVFDAVSPYGYPGIVLSQGAAATEGFADACVSGLLEALRTHQVCTAFVRLHPLLNADLPRQLRSHPLTASGLTVSMDLLQSEDRLWATMRKGHTNAINKARRAGYRIEIGSPQDRLHDFAAVYAETLQRLGAAAAYDFGPEHLRRLAAMNDACLAVALLDDQVAGAYLFFERNGIVQMHLGGTRSAYMRPSPSHLLIHTIALRAKSGGNFVLHLGGGVGGSASDSLFMFKSGFSPRRHSYYTLRLVADDALYQALVATRARTLALSPEELLTAQLFPAYRATLGPKSMTS